MSHDKVNYIIEVIADNWDRPESFGAQDSVDQSGTYRIIDNRTDGVAAYYEYFTTHTFPPWITKICPFAPDCNHEEALELGNTQGPSGFAWAKPVII